MPHPKGWHFGVHGEGRFSGECESGYVRFSAKKGAKGFRMAGHYSEAARKGGGATAAPLEIEHFWYEEDPCFGRRLRRHLECTEAAEHDYTVACTAEPHDDRVEMRVPSSAR